MKKNLIWLTGGFLILFFTSVTPFAGELRVVAATPEEDSNSNVLPAVVPTPDEDSQPTVLPDAESLPEEDNGASVLSMTAAPTPEEDSDASVFLANGRSWIGVGIKDISADRARELKLSGGAGVLVTGVEKDSPAAKAGLQQNDVILEFDGERVRSAAQLRRLIHETPAQRTVKVTVDRAGASHTLDLTVGSRSGDFGFLPAHDYHFEIHPMGPLFGPHPTLGILGDDLTAQLASYFGVKQGKGVLVREVKPGTAAEKAGLKAGDCIVRVGTKEIGSVEDLREALAQNSGKDNVPVQIVRDRHEQTLSVKLERPADQSPWRKLEGFDYGDIAGATDLAESYKQLAQQTRDDWRHEMERLRQELKDLRPKLLEQQRKLKEELQSPDSDFQKGLRDLRRQLRKQRLELRDEI